MILQRKPYTLLLAALAMCVVAGLSGCREDTETADADGDVEEERKPAIPRFYLEEPNSLAGRSTQLVELPVSKTTFSVATDPIFHEFDVAQVELVKVRMGLALRFSFDELATRKLYRESVTSNGQRIALFVNGKPVGARRIDGAIEDGVLYTFVEMPDDEIEELTMDLQETISEIRTAIHKQR